MTRIGGQCDHCARTQTPCWRKGPPEKPVLCNACGVRWLVKHSLEGYMPSVKPSAAAAAAASADGVDEAKRPGQERSGLRERKRKERSATPEPPAKVLFSSSGRGRGKAAAAAFGGEEDDGSDSSQQYRQEQQRRQQQQRRRQQGAGGGAQRGGKRRKSAAPDLIPEEGGSLPALWAQSSAPQQRNYEDGEEQYDVPPQAGQYDDGQQGQYAVGYGGVDAALLSDLVGRYGETGGYGGDDAAVAAPPAVAAAATQLLPGFLPLFVARRKDKVQVNRELMADLADAAASLALLHRTSRHLFARPVQPPRRPRKQARPVACC